MESNKESIFSNKLISCLIAENFLSEKKAKEVLQEAHFRKISLIHHLVESRLLSSKLLAEKAAKLSGLTLVDLHQKPREHLLEIPLNMLFLYQNRLIPLWQHGKLLSVGLSDPSQLHALQNLQFGTGLTIEPLLIQDDQLEAELNKVREKDLNEIERTQKENSLQEDISIDKKTDNENEDAPTIKFINQLLQNAIRNGASDLHFEPQESCYRIRQRCDGKLSIISEPSIKLAQSITIRLKIIAGLDISEKKKPQDGRVRFSFPNLPRIDARINCLPTIWGEKIAIRLLDPRKSLLDIEELGLEEEQKKLFIEAITKSQGMILVTGPTGSGKTVSLYSALKNLNKSNLNISTAEDPVEINLPGINQVNINPKQGLDFSTTLRAFLRQDPDIIMIGEIRDKETAEIAIKAAQTGHLVLSTLHTNSALETITRLYNMGIPSVDIASSISLIIAQRLVRKLCLQCRTTLEITDDILSEFKEIETDKKRLTVFTANGCQACNDGYKGRIGIYEMLPINDNIQNLILQNRQLKKIMDKDVNFINLKTSGLKKVLKGITSLEEIHTTAY